jgi:hypothetical protein
MLLWNNHQRRKCFIREYFFKKIEQVDCCLDENVLKLINLKWSKQKKNIKIPTLYSYFDKIMEIRSIKQRES